METETTAHNGRGSDRARAELPAVRIARNIPSRSALTEGAGLGWGDPGAGVGGGGFGAIGGVFQGIASARG
jgi:hypothetical protein